MEKQQKRRKQEGQQDLKYDYEQVKEKRKKYGNIASIVELL